MVEDSSKLDEKQTEVELKEVKNDIDGSGVQTSPTSTIDSTLAVVAAAAQSSQVDSSNKELLDQVELPDNLEVLELIGRGGTGQVYKVRDKELDRILAVKVLRKELMVDTQTVKRFSHEANAAAGLSHANVVSVYGHGETKDGSPFITMNFIDGESLSTILKRENTLEWNRIVDLFIQLCDGLEHAHEQGLVHRDLKPSNIIISATAGGVELAHIVDFGIAKIITTRGDTLNTLTASGDFLGTPMYMSPEQCLGQNVDHRTDIYAIGCMLFEALSGKAPFAGGNSVEIIAKKMSEESPTLKTKNVPANVSMIVSCCMARHPQDRYANVKALKNDLEALSKNLDPKHARLKIGMDKNVAGKRLLAAFIDYIILSSVTGLFNTLMYIALIAVAAVVRDSGDSFAGPIGAIAAGALWLVFPVSAMLLYYTLFEAFRGRTPGKQLCGLCICDAYGNQLTKSKAFMRNLWKGIIVIVLPAMGLAGFALPEHSFGILTTMGTISLSLVICIRSLIVQHQLPWDLLVGAQIRRR